MIWTAETILKAVAKSKLKCMTEADVMKATGLSDVQVQQACLKLRSHEFLTRTEQGCHALTETGREALAAGVNLRSGPKGRHIAPRVLRASLRTKVWRAMRIRGKFSIPELSMLVAEGGEKDITSNIGKYCRALERAGFIVKMAKRELGSKLTSNGHLRYWLIPERDTGTKAPVWRERAKTVFDPNTELEHAC